MTDTHGPRTGGHQPHGLHELDGGDQRHLLEVRRCVSRAIEALDASMRVGFVTNDWAWSSI
jgi:hypothetical protein